MSTNLMEANQQWANRPADERCWTIAELQERATRYQMEAREADCRLSDLSVVDLGENLGVKGESGTAATLGHYAFGQLANLAGAPAAYLRTLPNGLASAAVNHGLHGRAGDKAACVLFNQNGDFRARAITSDRYARIWNADVVKRLSPLESEGWMVPPARPAHGDQMARPATADDVLKSAARQGGIAIREGDLIAPAGLYISEKDMFAFLVNEERGIQVGGKELYRGFFVQNSEVGDAAFKLTTFLYNTVCGNHIVWGAENVKEARVVHRGSTADRRAWASIGYQLREYANEAAGETERRIRMAQTFMLGDNKEEVLDFLFGRKIGSRRMLEAAYDTAVEHPEDHGDCDPNSAWAFVNGATRLSQRSQHADARVDIDRAAGQVLKIAF